MELEDFLERLCSYSYTTEIWFTLWRAGGAFSFYDVCRYAGCSRRTVRRSLRVLWGDGLVKMVNGKYRVVAPEWLRSGTGGTDDDVRRRV